LIGIVGVKLLICSNEQSDVFVTNNLLISCSTGIFKACITVVCKSGPLEICVELPDCNRNSSFEGHWGRCFKGDNCDVSRERIVQQIVRELETMSFTD